MERVSNVNVKSRLKQLVVLLSVMTLCVIITKVVEARKANTGFIKAEIQK